MRLLRFIILFFIFCESIFCQNSSKLDSLLKVLPTQKEDTLKVKTFINIGNILKRTDTKGALEYAEKALSLAENLKWIKGQAYALEIIWFDYNTKGDFISALNIGLKALEKWEEIDFKKGIQNSCCIVGVSYSDLGDNKTAMKYYLRSLKLAEESKDEKNMIRINSNIASIYSNQKQYPQALLCYSKALNAAEKIDFKDMIAASLGNMGKVYSDQRKHALALSCYFKAMEIDEKLGNKMRIPAWLANIAGTYQLQSDSAQYCGDIKLMNEKSKKALTFMFEAYEKNKELGNKYFEANILGNIGAILIAQKKYDEALIYVDKAYLAAQESNSSEEIINAQTRYSELYKLNNKPELALKHYERYSELSDSISNEDNKKVISELQIKYETEKKESENSALSQQNKILELSVTNQKYLTYGLVIILILAFGMGFLIIRQSKLKSHQENVMLEQKLLRSQMNPHFIFNSLSSIESFIYEHQPKEAGNYLSQFARLIRLTLENSASEYITLEKEIETLTYYLELQKLRLNDNMKYHINVDEGIQKEQILIPPMLTQPFIENVIEHAFRGVKECGIIDISFKLKDKYLEIKITDNGIGFTQAQQQKGLYQNHTSMATKITYERLKYLNKSKKQKLIFSIKESSLENERKGTEVTFSIPV